MLPNEANDNPYLQQEVFTASPFQLRWMLIQRAEALCGFVQQLWLAGDDLQAASWLLRIREILGELLDGIKDKDNPVSQQVSDFYVYLLQLLTRVERTRDAEKLKTLEELLQIENETWKQVVQKSLSETAGGTTPPFPSINVASSEQTNDYSGDYSGGLSLEL
jgi:flagellin-specific chaperone FliS